MKVRIKIIEKNNGAKVFIPQAKDNFSFIRMILNIFTISLFGKRLGGYRGLIKMNDELNSFEMFLGFKPGEIVQCSEKEATRFIVYEDAQAFLQEFVMQEKNIIYKTKEEKLKIKIAEEHEKARAKGEKIKSVKYVESFDVKV